MNYLSKVQVILPKKTKTTDTHNISTIDIILFYLDLFKNKILGTYYIRDTRFDIFHDFAYATRCVMQN